MEARGRAQSRAASEIGPPPITAKQRAAGTRLRKECANNLELFNFRSVPVLHRPQAIRLGAEAVDSARPTSDHVRLASLQGRAERLSDNWKHTVNPLRSQP